MVNAKRRFQPQCGTIVGNFLQVRYREFKSNDAGAVSFYRNVNRTAFCAEIQFAGIDLCCQAAAVFCQASVVRGSVVVPEFESPPPPLPPPPPPPLVISSVTVMIAVSVPSPFTVAIISVVPAPTPVTVTTPESTAVTTAASLSLVSMEMIVMVSPSRSSAMSDASKVVVPAAIALCVGTGDNASGAVFAAVPGVNDRAVLTDAAKTPFP